MKSSRHNIGKRTSQVLAIFFLFSLSTGLLFADQAPVKKKKRVRIHRPFVLPANVEIQVTSKQTQKSLLKPTTQASFSTYSTRNVTAKRFSRRPATSDEVIYKLTRRTMSVNYSDQSLESVLLDLRNRLGINLIVFWPELTLAGIDKEDIISLELDRVTPQLVLESILNLAAAGKGVQMVYRVDRGILHISVKGKMPERMVLKSYYVADLMTERSDAENSNFGNNGGTGQGQNNFSSGFGNNNRFGSGSGSSNSFGNSSGSLQFGSVNFSR